MTFLFLLALILVVVAIIIWFRDPKSKILQWLGLIIAVLLLIVLLNLLGWSGRPL